MKLHKDIISKMRILTIEELYIFYYKFILLFLFFIKIVYVYIYIYLFIYFKHYLVFYFFPDFKKFF